MDRIKKHNNGNEYLYCNEVWVRNFTKIESSPIDLNHLIEDADYRILIDNESRNHIMHLQQIDTEEPVVNDLVIVSDGFDFQQKHRILSQLPPHVWIFAVNGALARWELVGPRCPEKEKRRINYYIVNNPYKECMSFIPRKTKYYPSCIMSPRTNHDFAKIYNSKGTLLQYSPVNNQNFKGAIQESTYSIDDYRNPICAAIGLAYRFGVERLCLFCCDESFADPRPGSVPVEGSSLFEYPQHKFVRELIDANLYWLTNQVESEVEVSHCSGGGEYKNASYIEPSNIAEFFR